MSILAALAGGPLISGIVHLIDKLIPDKDLREKTKAQLEILEATGELQIMLQQIEVNVQEAKHPSVFVAGWRPFIGWVCALALGYHFIIVPLILFGAALVGVNVPLPEFDMSTLMSLVLGMLGIGGLRTYEKFKGVARNSWPEGKK